MNRSIKIASILLWIGLAGCQAVSQSPDLFSTATPTSGAAIQPTASVTPTALASKTVTPTITPEPVVQWSVPYQEISLWTSLPEQYDIKWLDNNTIQTGAFDQAIIQFDPAGDQEPVIVPTATPFHNLDTREYVYSPQGSYAVACTEKAEDGTRMLQLYRQADDTLLGEVNVDIEDYFCGWAISWASDESAFTFTTKANQDTKDALPVAIYIWKVDRSRPTQIGGGSYLEDAGSWSPDLKRILVEVRGSDFQSENESTYVVLYPDGREGYLTEAQLYGQRLPGVFWLTNQIAYIGSGMGAMCFYNEYYMGDTGENLSDLFWGDCDFGALSNNTAELSPDQRWFVLDQTDQSPLQPNEPFNFTYTLFDFSNMCLYTLSSEPDIFMDFVGWAPDSATFYLTRNPENDGVSEKEDAPFGLLALDVRTRQMTLVSADIREARMSPDGQHILGWSAEDGKLVERIYTLDGAPVVEIGREPLPTPYSYDYAEEMDSIWWGAYFSNSMIPYWSNNGRMLAYKDGAGNFSIADVDGHTKTLVTGLGLGPEGHGYSLEWSPDDTRLIIYTDAKAFIAFLE